MFMRKYETVVLISPDSGDEGVQKVTSRLREGLETTKGKEIRLEDWGVKRLAYELNGNRRSHYLYLLYLGTNKTVAEVERLMKITEAVVKYQTVALEALAVAGIAFLLVGGFTARHLGLGEPFSSGVI